MSKQESLANAIGTSLIHLAVGASIAAPSIYLINDTTLTKAQSPLEIKATSPEPSADLAGTVYFLGTLAGGNIAGLGVAHLVSYSARRYFKNQHNS